MRHQIPVWMSHGTHAGVGSPDFDGLLQLARDGVAIELGELHLMPFTVPHDAREPLQLRCSDGASSLGILTDLGHATDHVLSQLAACQALLLECNHDADMLASGRLPGVPQAAGRRRTTATCPTPVPAKLHARSGIRAWARSWQPI